MQTPYTQQAYGQYPSTQSHNSGSLAGYPPRPEVTDFMTPVFAQRVSPSYDARPYTTQSDQPAIRTGPQYGNDAYGGGSISGYGPNHAMAGSWGTPAPQPLQNRDYSMPHTIPYSPSNLRQSEPYYAGYHFGTEQVPGPTMPVGLSPHLPEAVPNQGDASSEWRFHTCWVSHAEEDKIHLTIALKKS